MLLTEKKNQFWKKKFINLAEIDSQESSKPAHEAIITYQNNGLYNECIELFTGFLMVWVVVRKSDLVMVAMVKKS